MSATLCLALALLAPTQDDPRLKTAEEQAQKCIDATISGDVEKLADLTHPKVIEKAGGREAMIEKVRKGMADLKDQGFNFDAGTVEAPKAIREADGKAYAVVPTTINISFDKGTLKAQSYLLGVSSDDGKTWTFLDGSPGPEAIRKLLPDIPEALELPEKKDPEFVPKG